MKTTEPLLTIEDLVTILKLNRRSIYRLMETGELNFGVKVGGQWRFLPADFNVWLGKKKREGLGI